MNDTRYQIRVLDGKPTIITHSYGYETPLVAWREFRLKLLSDLKALDEKKRPIERQLALVDLKIDEL